MFSTNQYKCCVPNCNKTRLDNTLLHKFPNPYKYPERFRTWKYVISGSMWVLDNDAIYKNRRICHRHFEPQYHTRSGMLSNIAVPTLHLPEKSVTEKTSGEPAKIDLPIDLNSTTDNTKLTTDDFIFAINAVENETAEKTCFNKDEFIRDNTASNAGAAENSAAEALPINEDIFNYNGFDDDGSQPTVPEAKNVPEAIFSWQKETDLLLTEIMDYNDSIVCPSVGEAFGLLEPADFSMYCDDEPKTAKSQLEPITSQLEPITSQPEPITIQPEPITIQPEPNTSPELNRAEYQCNECRNDIVGFRYTCVQCASWDLCGACEARTAHATHYVLRVPSARPYTEIQAVLTAIRQQLLSENHFLNKNFTNDSLKVEVKDEPSEAPPAPPEPAPEPDPLEAHFLCLPADSKNRVEQSNYTKFAVKNATKLRTYGKSAKISASGESTRKLGYHIPKLLPTDSPTEKVVHDYVTQRASDNKGQLAESPAPHRVQPTDDVISLDDTPNTTSIGKFNTIARHINPLQSQIVGSNNVPLDASEAPDRVEGSLETSVSRLLDDDQTIVLRVPSGTNKFDLTRALCTKVTVRLESLRVEVIEFIPAKKKKTEI